MSFVKHLVECQCVLNIFKNKTKAIYHKIPVFSLIDEEGNVKEKYIACNNCGIIHRVYEVCKSEIKWGHEDDKSMIPDKDDIKFNLEAQGYEKIVSIFEQNDLEICDWEILEYSLDNGIECDIVLNRVESDNNVIIKIISISSDGKFKLKKEIVQRYL